ncbi:uncharacterized protein ARMOST_15374 [Armillaria ostoyae]|uniref:Uncharacterized protein n=1 Tax=Armillaria ostoyae TaxID=47428 RepID=A0A284RT96_ARMOS|nr:uncharacterized protein ARMOST_15374 [Armillaria ostoyae]
MSRHSLQELVCLLTVAVENRTARITVKSRYP